MTKHWHVIEEPDNGTDPQANVYELKYKSYNDAVGGVKRMYASRWNDYKYKYLGLNQRFVCRAIECEEDPCTVKTNVTKEFVDVK
jgi:hypothetical protein